MLVNNKAARVITIARGEGLTKCILVPGLNTIPDDMWNDNVKKALQGHIASGIVIPIYKVEKQKVKGDDGKEKTVEVNAPCSPDDIPSDKLDGVVNEIMSEDQADKFESAATKDVVKNKALNRKKAIAKENENRKNA